MKYKIASIISYCSYHNPYLEKCIEEAKKVSDEVIVVANTHFFNGVQDTELRKDLITHQLSLTEGYTSRQYHNIQRHDTYDQKLRKKGYDFIFFIDADEILEGDKVKLWLEEIVEKGENYKLSHYWYYRDTCYRANQVEEGAVLVSTETLNSKDMNWFGDREREDFCKDWNYMASYKNQVLGHHYSWAGTKKMILKKVSSWGHNADNYNWKQMVEDEYSREFNYRCPFKPYVFNKIEPFVGFTFDAKNSRSN